MRRVYLAVPFAVAVVAASPIVAQPTAQPGALDGRVNRLEREMRAVQRQVFPNGAVQPELGGAPAPATPSGSAATAPIADLTARVDAIERQLQTITGANEQAGFRVRQLEESVARLQSRLSALETAGGGTAPPTTSSATPAPAVRSDEMVEPARSTARPSLRPAATVANSRPSTRPDPARRALVAAVELPSTGDAVEDEYTYAFRLYDAQLYPEAQTKLKTFVAAHPTTNKRWSYAQNLLGRAYLDEGKPALASVAFYDNYQKAPRGERASESLYWLGRSLTRLGKLADACKVYDELADVYGAKLTSDARARAAKGRQDAKCATQSS